jgi:hypothetical protein
MVRSLPPSYGVEQNYFRQNYCDILVIHTHCFNTPNYFISCIFFENIKRFLILSSTVPSWDTVEGQAVLTSTMLERVGNSATSARPRPRHFPRPSGKIRHRPRHFNAPIPCRHFTRPLTSSSPLSVPVIIINISPNKSMKHNQLPP